MEFKNEKDLNIDLFECYKNCDLKISDYSVGIKRMWSDVINSEYALSNGCLIVKDCYMGEYSFNLPVPTEDGADITAAIEDIALYCRESFIPLRFDYVPKDKIGLITSIFPTVEVTLENELSDYVYFAEDFKKFAGKKYSGQRNHIKKFHAQCPDAKFTTLEEGDKNLIQEFFNHFKSEFENTTAGAYDELLRAEALSITFGNDRFLRAGFVNNGALISFCLCEICGDVAINHIEKAFTEYTGVYPATAQAFARILPQNVIYLNREDDAGIRGLRISKLQYGPCDKLKKYSVKVNNALSAIEAHPSLSTDRLVLDTICEADAEKYYRLCTDTERNKYWGYDYTETVKDPDTDFFYLDQKKDLENRCAINFAIRYKGKFAGEVILYDFDFCGTCEIGVRILPEFDRRGIGKEAMNAVAEYAIYTLGIDKVRAKCFKDNLPSKRMLSAIMNKAGEDEQFYYFTKSV